VSWLRLPLPWGIFRVIKTEQGLTLHKQFGSTLLALIFVVATGLSGSALSGEKGYYKWDDKKGNPHHSDRPPPAGVEYQFIATESGRSRRVTAEQSRTQGLPSPTRTTSPTEAQQKATEKAAAVDKNPALCDQARANLDTLNSKARVRIRDGDDIRYLSEEEKEIQRQKSRDLMAVHCS
jgi:hypothetical protein